MKNESGQLTRRNTKTGKLKSLNPYTSSDMAGPTMGPHQPPSTPPSDSLYSLQPANTDNPVFQGSWFDERLFDPSAPSQGPSMGPEELQGNCLPDPPNQSSMHNALCGSIPSGNGPTDTL